jgi:stage II sporulation protein AA (anti-sigma F factor antagonist)
MATEVTINITQPPEHDKIRLIKLNGEIDESNLDEFKARLDPLAEEKNCLIIILNLKDLTYINSKVIGYLASYYSKLTDLGKKMIFCEANPNIMDILSLVGLTNIVEYFEIQSEAINASLVD